MPLPNSKVLIALLEEYKKNRSEKWVAPIEGTVSNFAKSVFGLDIPGDRRSQCQRLEHRFAEANNVEDWINVLDEIGRAIKEAEGQLYWSRESLFAETLHAIRSYIVALLKYQPKDNQVEDTREEFYNLIDDIKLKLEQQKIAIEQERHRGLDAVRVDELIKEKNLTLRQLAFLGDENAIFDAVDLNLFPRDRYEYPDRDTRRRIEQLHSLSPDSVNVNKPLYLQDKYYYIFYAKNFFKQTNLSFREFIQKASMEEHHVNMVDIEEILFEHEPARSIAHSTHASADDLPEPPHNETEANSRVASPSQVGVFAEQTKGVAENPSQDARQALSRSM